MRQMTKSIVYTLYRDCLSMILNGDEIIEARGVYYIGWLLSKHWLSCQILNIPWFVCSKARGMNDSGKGSRCGFFFFMVQFHMIEML